MKKTALILVSLVLMLMFSQEVFTHVGGAYAGYSGGAGEQNCTKCHTGTLGSGPGTVSLTHDVPGGTYVPGDTYNITATINEAGLVRYGFEVLVGHNAVGNKTEGTIILNSTTETQIKASGTKRYVTHKLAGTTGSNTRTWTFRWVAPNPSTGPVSFYAGFNGANNNNAKTGDHIYLASFTLDGVVANAPAAPVAAEVKAYPTLVDDQLHLSWPSVNSVVVAEIINLNGQVVARHDFSGLAENASLEASSWAAGTYVVRVKAGETLSHFKVVKM